jgi:hypothetical protein
MSIIGKKIAFLYYTQNIKVEGTGVVLDKVQSTDRIFDEQGNLQFVSPQDIYLVRKDDGDCVCLNPFNVLKVFENEKSN